MSRKRKRSDDKKTGDERGNPPAHEFEGSPKRRRTGPEDTGDVTTPAVVRGDKTVVADTRTKKRKKRKRIPITGFVPASSLLPSDDAASDRIPIDEEDEDVGAGSAASAAAASAVASESALPIPEPSAAPPVVSKSILMKRFRASRGILNRMRVMDRWSSQVKSGSALIGDVPSEMRPAVSGTILRSTLGMPQPYHINDVVGIALRVRTPQQICM